jgi:hypothetical protein
MNGAMSRLAKTGITAGAGTLRESGESLIVRRKG